MHIQTPPTLNGSNRLLDARRPAVLHLLAVDAGSGRADDALARLVAALVVDVLDVEGVDVPGEVPEHRQQDVDEQVGAF